jgi:hypothetical protein
MNILLELLSKIATRNDITDGDKLATIRVISTLILDEGAANARLQRLNQGLLVQLQSDERDIIPPYEPTAGEVEILQTSFTQLGYDLSYYAPNHQFPKGVFYAEKRQA